MEGDLGSALRGYTMAAVDEPECLLTAWYRVNVLRNIDGKEMEAAVCWLEFMGIPLDQQSAFYQGLMDDEERIELFVVKRTVVFREFGHRHRIWRDGDGLIFSFVFELPEYQLSKAKVTEMTRVCIGKWIESIHSADCSVWMPLLS